MSKNLNRSFLCLLLAVIAPVCRASVYMVTSNADSGDGSLRDALNRVSSGDSIRFNLGDGANRIRLESYLYVPWTYRDYASFSVTIDGYNGGRGIVLEGKSGTAFYCNLNHYVTFRNMTFADCKARAIVVRGASLTLSNCVFRANVGGAICVETGTSIYAPYTFTGLVRAHGCTFVGNQAPDGNGGAVSVTANNSSYGSADFNVCSFIGNVASGKGGAVYNEGYSAFRSCTFAENQASSGSAIAGSGGGLTLMNCAVCNSVSYTGSISSYYTICAGSFSASSSVETRLNCDRDSMLSGGIVTQSVAGVEHVFRFPARGDLAYQRGCYITEQIFIGSGNYYYTTSRSSTVWIADLVGQTLEDPPSIGAIDHASCQMAADALRVTDIAVGEDAFSVALDNAVPGFYYGLGWSAALGGDFSVEEDGWVCASDKVLPLGVLSAPKAGNCRFYRVKVEMP